MGIFQGASFFCELGVRGSLWGLFWGFWRDHAPGYGAAMHRRAHPSQVTAPRKRPAQREILVEAERLDGDGQGVSSPTSAPQLCVHVPGLLPGERAIVEVLHVSPHAAAEAPTGSASAWARVKTRLN